ncbi:MAG: hypothetical protein JW991_00505 [Candidatus Pacebacteria bacterium]|nr:hypothetical protein [Candidatus Paceibacterota bacterium]
MAKLLRIKDYLRLGLALGHDLVNEFYQPTQLDLMARRETYGWVPAHYQPRSRFKAIQRLLAAGEIERIIKNGKPYFRLTGKGSKTLKRDFLIFKLRERKWDENWTVVFFDIPEKKRSIREQLVQKLKSLGFGQIQRSVYLSPFDLGSDLADFISFKKMAAWVFVARVGELFAGDKREIAAKVWPLTKINRLYQALLNDWQKRSELDNQKKRVLERKIKSRYLEILAQDPCLPDELLPDDWRGDEVRQILKEKE